MDDVKLEALTPAELKEFFNKAVWNAELNHLNAWGAFVSTKAALDAIKQKRDEMTKEPGE